jgi:phosphopantothenate synthetase
MKLRIAPYADRWVEHMILKDKALLPTLIDLGILSRRAAKASNSIIGNVERASHAKETSFAGLTEFRNS